MKRRLIKKWNKGYYHSVGKCTDYTVNCYKKLKQWFPYIICLKPWANIVDHDKVEKYLGIKKKREYG